jgi:hypothetical protein
MNIVPEAPDNTYVANNIFVMVNGHVQGHYKLGSGQIVNGNLYWKMNAVDSNPLVSNFDTVPALFSGTGLERNGLGEMPRHGTNPRFKTFNLDVDDRSQSVWALRPSSEIHKPSDFLLAGDSPAIGAAIVLPVHPILGALPDSRVSQDIGAVPSNAKASDYDVFPFVPRTGP